MTEQDTYMYRCLELASLGAGHVAPNPMVGAVLVHNHLIIGEGYHQVYGGPHAEVNCLNSVPLTLQPLIKDSVMYVSLEPCAHHGKTPPCADLLIRHQIGKVCIGCRDPFAEVDGKGIEKLHAAGIETVTGILEDECKLLNKRFFTFQTKHRPYIILKWAQTANGKIGHDTNERLCITGSTANRIVHKWRSEEASVMVGTTTAAKDDPRLDNRLWSGRIPARIVIDADLRLPASLHVFDNRAQTIVFNTKKHVRDENIFFYQINRDTDLVPQVLEALYQMKVLSVLIEGGARLLQSFIDANEWDEARVLTNESLLIGAGVAAPVLGQARLVSCESLGKDRLTYFLRN